MKGKRGPRSAADLAVAQPAPALARPDPPDDLTPAQATIWRAVVADLHVAYFDSAAQGILRDYCTAATEVQRLDGEISQSSPNLRTTAAARKRHTARLTQREKLVRLKTTLLTKLRLTPQARVSREDAERAIAPTHKKPWEFTGYPPDGFGPKKLAAGETCYEDRFDGSPESERYRVIWERNRMGTRRNSTRKE